MEKIKTIDPATGETLAEYPVHDQSGLNHLFEGSRKAFLAWRHTPMSERTQTLERLAMLFRERKPQLSVLMHKEMGKLAAEAESEIEKCAVCCEYYAKNAEALLAPIDSPSDARKSYVAFEPLGTVLAIMPWNFPFWQAVRCAAPAIAAGNAVVLKHASNVTGCALALEKIFQDAARENLFRTVVVPGKDALALIARKEVAAVSLTGSTEVGRQVAAVAGHELKKCVLELGGSDAYVVLRDADLAKAAKTCAQSRLINAGQSCIAAKRFIVEAGVIGEFTKLFVEELQKIPLAPLARKDLQTQLHAQVEKAVKGGAKVLCGGKVPEGKGCFYPATALACVNPGNAAFEEEFFGPVAAIIEAEDEKDAVRLANLSQFGLGAAVFTKDQAKAERIARHELEAGSCFANALVKSDPRLPFGGVKDSGFGRELAGFGIREFTNVKTVFLA